MKHLYGNFRKVGFIMRRFNSDTIYNILVYTVLTILSLVVAYPLYFIVIASISKPVLVSTGQVYLFPRGINFMGYQKIFEYTELWHGYANTIFYTIGFTLLSVFVTLLAGFALSRRNLAGRNAVMMFFTITMFFSGGLVPTYFLIRDLGLMNTRFVIILIGSVSIYRIIITRTFFSSSIPDELYEAASIDGCNHFTFFFKVVLPLSSAIIAVLVIYSAVQQWNSWFNALIYLKDPSMMPLQMVLRKIIINQKEFMDSLDVGSSGGSLSDQLYVAETMKYGIIIVSSLPVLMLYPFAQKHFAKGVMIGSIKG